MRDKQLKDMCIMLGIQLPSSSYDSKAEMDMARGVPKDYAPGIYEAVHDAEKNARVIEFEEARYANAQSDGVSIAYALARNFLWNTVDGLVRHFFEGLPFFKQFFKQLAFQESEKPFYKQNNSDYAKSGSETDLEIELRRVKRSENPIGDAVDAEGSKYLTEKKARFSSHLLDSSLLEKHNTPKMPEQAFTGVVGVNRDLPLLSFFYLGEGSERHSHPEFPTEEIKPAKKVVCADRESFSNPNYSIKNFSLLQDSPAKPEEPMHEDSGIIPMPIPAKVPSSKSIIREIREGNSQYANLLRDCLALKKKGTGKPDDNSGKE